MSRLITILSECSNINKYVFIIGKHRYVYLWKKVTESDYWFSVLYEIHSTGNRWERTLAFLLPKTFKLFGFQIFIALSVPDDGYSRDAPRALNSISTLLFQEGICTDDAWCTTLTQLLSKHWYEIHSTGNRWERLLILCAVWNTQHGFYEKLEINF
jgi:hypothetical protein